MFKNIFRSRRSKAKLFSYIDWLFPKIKNKTLFVVKDRTYLSGNLRVLLETYIVQSKDKLYIYKDGKLSVKLKDEIAALGVTVLHGFTFYSIWHILTASTLILSHNPRDAHITKKSKKRKIINLWHGVAIKKIELLMPSIKKDKLLLLKNNSRLYDMVIASSEQDKLTNVEAFGVPVDKVHITGLPRYEILKETYVLGTVLQEENNKIIEIIGDKQLVLFAPTFRENNVSAIAQITIDEWQQLYDFAKTTNILFGIRPHPYDIQYLPDIIKHTCHFYLFDSSEYTEVNLLLKHTDILVVDFSSIWVDYLLLHRPIVGFAKDHDRYLKKERGFIYDFNSVFPATFTSQIDELILVIKKEISNNEPIVYKNALDMFHRYSLDYEYSTKVYNEISNMPKG